MQCCRLFAPRLVFPIKQRFGKSRQISKEHQHKCFTLQRATGFSRLGQPLIVFVLPRVQHPALHSPPVLTGPSTAIFPCPRCFSSAVNAPVCHLPSQTRTHSSKPEMGHEGLTSKSNLDHHSTPFSSSSSP